MNKLVAILSLLLIFNCKKDTSKDNPVETSTDVSVDVETEQRTNGYSETKNAYFGNMHIHTSYSFDGFTNKCPTTPTDAYRWAKGETIPGGGGGDSLTINTPLDFYAVSDHAEWMGMFKLMEDPDHPLSQLDFAKRVTSDDPAIAFQAFADFLYDFSNDGDLAKEPLFSDPEVQKSVWAEIVSIADQHYIPGKFTTFPAFEWTSNPDNRNLHRVVVFRDSKNVPQLAYSSNESSNPEDLWAWMDESRANGATLLAIPHNGNASDGLMFSNTNFEGVDLNKAYSEIRMRNEPLYEISQIKGTSEVHPDLSPNDEFADFELWDYTLAATADRPTNRKGSYLRQAYLDGLKLDSEGKGNPFKYGIIGDSDSHNSAATIEEDNYTGKFAIENDPEHRLNGPAGFAEKNKQQLREFSSGGLAGVWAEENTREAIFNAMERKETFGTSGSRLKVRFFGSFSYDDDITSDNDWLSNAYDYGVPMGSDLKGSGNAPIFIIHALKEADGANLDRAQIVKGWIDADGNTHEKIYNIAWSDDRKLGADGSLPKVGNTVNLTTATYTNSIGNVEFLTTWTDPDFDANQKAFYYLRVLEIPTPRWSTYDAVKTGLPLRDDLPATIQERAWSSPIWYNPN